MASGPIDTAASKAKLDTCGLEGKIRYMRPRRQRLDTCGLKAKLDTCGLQARLDTCGLRGDEWVRRPASSSP